MKGKAATKCTVANPIRTTPPFTIMQIARKSTWLPEQTAKWKHEITEKEKWIQKYNEKRVWVEREESWECKIAPPSGHRIILWADGSSLCVGWHFLVTSSRVMLCDVCDWLLPRPWEAARPRGHLLLACSEFFILALSALFCLLLSLLLSRLHCSLNFWSSLSDPVVSTFNLRRMHLYSSVTPPPQTPIRWLLRGNSKPCL